MSEAAIRLYLATLDAATQAAAPGLTDEERDRVATMSPKRRREFEATRALARYAIERAAGIPAKAQRFVSAAGGKPVCIDGPAISLSHSEGWTACGVASRGEIGIDLQFVVERTGVERIADVYFSPAESAWVAAGARDRFFKLWVLKEAYLKATGQGLGGGLKSVEYLLTESRIEARFGEGPTARLLLYAFGDAFLGIATLGAAGREIELNVLDPRPDGFGELRLIASSA